MIDVVKKTPREYVEQSRDFQVLARLYTALFNISKMYADDLKVWVPDIDNKLTTLRSRTVNFVNRHQWDLNDLEAITSCFKYLMRRKGTEEALEACINILMKARGIETGITVDSVVIDRYGCINIWVAHDNILMGIMEDLIRYLIPTGLTYRLYDYDLEVVNAASGIVTDIYYRQDFITKNDAGDVPSSFNELRYPFNKAMTLGKPTDKLGDIIQYNVYPTSYLRSNNTYSHFITDTFIYSGSEGVVSVTSSEGVFIRPFILYAFGRTLYVTPEMGPDGTVLAPTITYDPTTETLQIGPSTPSPISGKTHDPRGVVFKPYDVNESEGTLIWNQGD